MIRSDGYVATNGHVVAASYEQLHDLTLVDGFVQDAVSKACGRGLAMLPDGLRKSRLAAIAADPRNRAGIQLIAKLQVHLSNGQIFPARVLAYSPRPQS